ncbi:MAG: ankyrin repeat domain-containing protein [Gammaproteobacteria bacterium]|nr:ankyrin repeat domain-containing protein [Gammaproteobacteria bacterium]
MESKELNQWSQFLSSDTSWGILIPWIKKHPKLIQENNLLHQAVIANKKDLVSLMLDYGVSPNHRDYSGRSPLHYAVLKESRLAIVALLLDNHAEQFPDNYGKTPLHLATGENNIEVVSKLLSVDHTMDLTLVDHENTTAFGAAVQLAPSPKILHIFLGQYVAKIDVKEIVSLIEHSKFDDNSLSDAAFLYLISNTSINLEELQQLSKKINVNYKDSYGNNALLIAAGSGRIDVMNWLINDLGFTLNSKNNGGFDPVLIAIAHGQLELLKELVERYQLSLQVKNHEGDDPVLMTIQRKHYEILRYLIEIKECPLEVRNNSRQDPVLTAVAFGNVPALKYLMELQNCALAVKNEQDKNRALLLALGLGKTEVAKYLIEEQNCSLDSANSNVAIIFGNLEVLRYWVDVHKHSLNVQPRLRSGTIFEATALGNFEVLRELAEVHGLSLDVVDGKGRGPLDYAVNFGQLKILRYLVEFHKLNLKPLTIFGFQLVAQAIGHGHIEVLRQLVNGYKLPLDFPRGPVFTAVEYGQIEMLRELANGFNLSLEVKNNKGQGLIEIAISYNCKKMLETLICSVAKGGFGLPLENPEKLLATANETIFQVIFKHEFERLLEQSCQQAVDWVQKIYLSGEPYVVNYDLKSVVTKLLEELINNYLILLKASPDSEATLLKIEVVVNALDEISPGQGTLHLGFAYLEQVQFVESYSYFLASFNNQGVESKKSASYEIVNLIMNGFVSLDAVGTLDAATTLENNALTDQEKDEIGKDIVVMQRRAIKSYEYLANDQSARAIELRTWLINVLSGVLNPSHDVKGANWLLSSTMEYRTYYRVKNPLMLLDETLNEALDGILADYKKLLSANKNDVKEQPVNNNNNGPVTLFFTKGSEASSTLEAGHLPAYDQKFPN